MPRAFLIVLIVYAAAGLALSLAAHIVSFFAIPPGGNALFVALHIAIFPLWLPVVVIASRMSGGGYWFANRLRWSDWNAILAAGPNWLRLMTYGFFVYAIANFAAFFLLSLAGRGGANPAGGPSAFVWHGFSGHWMAFYSAGLAIAMAAYRRGPGNLARTCPNGHPVGPSDPFCSRCGRAISN